MPLKRFPRPRLITFDAYGTLLTPKGSVSQQYVKYMSRHGVHAEAPQIETNFKAAFKAVLNEYPNYGKSVGMTIDEWWIRVVRGTFQGVPNVTNEALTGLYRHFNTCDPYFIFPDCEYALEAIGSRGYNIGILSNSDPRMRSILDSFGLTPRLRSRDRDFFFLSYETGFEKPSADAFRNVQRAMLDHNPEDTQGCWHVGDDVETDFKGCLDAGWNAILVDREGEAFEHALRHSNGNGQLSADGRVLLVNENQNTGIQIYLRDLRELPLLFD
uniref:ARAD1A10340p n=1 Tax=Blastobotrys adeninivorans TaxID=409370 RepID=A0A060SY82_BLAAD